jgi:hypothetical protein
VTTNLLPLRTAEARNKSSVAASPLNFRFYDGNDWVDEWDSTADANSLPRAVEVDIRIARQAANRAKELQKRRLIQSFAFLRTAQQTTGIRNMKITQQPILAGSAPGDHPDRYDLGGAGSRGLALVFARSTRGRHRLGNQVAGLEAEGIAAAAVEYVRPKRSPPRKRHDLDTSVPIRLQVGPAISGYSARTWRTTGSSTMA